MGKDYTKFSKDDNKKVVVETVNVPEVKEPEKVEKVKPTIGIVTDCIKLNVRKEPNTDAEIVCTIDASTDLVINENESTEDFYKICTVAGIEGYCVKRYITIIK